MTPNLVRLPKSLLIIDMNNVVAIIRGQINQYGLIIRGLAQPLEISGEDVDALIASKRIEILNEPIAIH